MFHMFSLSRGVLYFAFTPPQNSVVSSSWTAVELCAGQQHLWSHRVPNAHVQSFDGALFWVRWKCGVGEVDLGGNPGSLFKRHILSHFKAAYRFGAIWMHASSWHTMLSMILLTPDVSRRQRSRETGASIGWLPPWLATWQRGTGVRPWSMGFPGGVQAGNLTGEMMKITGFFLCYFQTNPHCVCVCVCVCIHTLQLTSRGVENWCACCLGPEELLLEAAGHCVILEVTPRVVWSYNNSFTSSENLRCLRSHWFIDCSRFSLTSLLRADRHQHTSNAIVILCCRSKDELVIGVAKHMEYAARSGYLAEDVWCCCRHASCCWPRIHAPYFSFVQRSASFWHVSL